MLLGEDHSLTPRFPFLVCGRGKDTQPLQLQGPARDPGWASEFPAPSVVAWLSGGPVIHSGPMRIFPTPRLFA